MGISPLVAYLNIRAAAERVAFTNNPDTCLYRATRSSMPRFKDALYTHVSGAVRDYCS